MNRARGWKRAGGTLAWTLAFVLAWSTTRNVARAESEIEARATFEQGVEASRAQKWDQARAHFQHSLELMPKASTMFNLAVAYIKLGLGREALEQLDAFEKGASPTEHAQMLQRAHVLRPQALALVDSQQATAQHGGNKLSHTDDGLDEVVRQQVQQARADYARGLDREALAGFEAAYKSSRRAELLYNIGVVADRLREDRKAARAYDMFVAVLPDAPEAAVAQVRSDALHAALAERERAGEAVQAHGGGSSSAQDERAHALRLQRPRRLLIAGVSLTAASTLSLALIGGLMGDKLRDYNRCLSSDSCLNADNVKPDRALTYVGLALSGAGFATGLGLTIAGGIKYQRAKQRLASARLVPSFAAGPGSAVLTLSGRF